MDKQSVSDLDVVVSEYNIYIYIYLINVNIIILQNGKRSSQE